MSDSTTTGLWDLSDPVVGVAGDWHGNGAWVRTALARLHVTGIKTLFQLGDFGVWPGERGRRYLGWVESYCAAFHTDLVVIAGNHDDWDQLNKAFAQHPGQPVRLRPHIWALPRGYRWVQAGRNFLAMGGAASVDFQYRRASAPATWWLGEIPTEAEIEAASAGGSVDILLLHDAPRAATPAVQRIRDARDPSFSAYAHAYADRSVELVTRLWDAVAPRMTLHGHYHVPDASRLPSSQWVVSLGRDEQVGNLGLLTLVGGDIAFDFLE